jgi:hypothetical protein
VSAARLGGFPVHPLGQRTGLAYEIGDSIRGPSSSRECVCVWDGTKEGWRFGNIGSPAGPIPSGAIRTAGRSLPIQGFSAHSALRYGARAPLSCYPEHVLSFIRLSSVPFAPRLLLRSFPSGDD